MASCYALFLRMRTRTTSKRAAPAREPEARRLDTNPRHFWTSNKKISGRRKQTFDVRKDIWMSKKMLDIQYHCGRQKHIVEDQEEDTTFIDDRQASLILGRPNNFRLVAQMWRGSRSRAKMNDFVIILNHC